MDIMKNKKNLKKRFFSVCCFAVFAFLQASHVDASKLGEEDIIINEPEERSIRVSNPPSRGAKSKCGFGGCDVEVKAPAIDVKVGVKQVNVKGGIKL